MKNILTLLLIGLMIFLVACGDEEQESINGEESNHEGHSDNQEDEDESLIPVVVEILVDDEIETGEQTLQARVTHNEEPIAEAEEVMFEVWEKDHKDDSDMVEATYTEDGIYEITYNFEEEGTYEMYAHVTAKSQHVMPKHVFEVNAN